MSDGDRVDWPGPRQEPEEEPSHRAARIADRYLVRPPADLLDDEEEEEDDGAQA